MFHIELFKGIRASRALGVCAVLYALAFGSAVGAIPLVDLAQEIQRGSNAAAVGSTAVANTQTVKPGKGDFTLNVSALWESVVHKGHATPAIADRQATNPDVLWTLEEQNFSAKPRTEIVKLSQGERLVGRVTIQMPQTAAGMDEANDMFLEIPMPRLDVMHMSYRYDDGPWIQQSAGDRIAMQAWPLVNRYPAFEIPYRAGKLHLVVELVHNGLVETPVMLKGNATFRTESYSGALRAGLMGGISLMLAIVTALMSLSFRRYSFLALSLMTVGIAWASLANTGILGMYFGTQSMRFNDLNKFASNMLACAVLPWIVAVMVSQKFYGRFLWRVAQVWVLAGVGWTVFMVFKESRDLAVQAIPPYLLACVVFALTLSVVALVRKQVNALPAVVGTVLYCAALLMPLFAYYGRFASADTGFFLSTFSILTATVLYLYVLFAQHRQGRMVVSSNKSSDGRDSLTGLFNVRGFEHALARAVLRIHSENTFAAFFYVEMATAERLRERYGDEGFEVGLVQTAAALSSCVSAYDTVGRVAPSAFAAVVMMPRDADIANSIATQMLSRVMGLAQHVAPLAQTARIAVAWIPTGGTTLPELKKNCERTLHYLGKEKRIAWVTNASSQTDISRPASTMHSQPKPSTLNSEFSRRGPDSISSLPGFQDEPPPRPVRVAPRAR
jgi:two-component system, sensor histidine kinase LadS